LIYSLSILAKWIVAVQLRTSEEVVKMLQIFVQYGEVIEVLEETDQPEPKRLKAGVDYEVEYI